MKHKLHFRETLRRRSQPTIFHQLLLLLLLLLLQLPTRLRAPFCSPSNQLTSVLMPFVTPNMVSSGTPLLPPQLSSIAPFLETKLTVTFLAFPLPLKGCCSIGSSKQGGGVGGSFFASY